MSAQSEYDDWRRKVSGALTPDDLMVVTIGMSFQAKDATGENPIDVPRSTCITLPAEPDTSAYLRAVADAIDAKRLFGFMQQECAAAPIAAGEWVAQTGEEIIAEALAEARAEIGA